MGRNAADRSGTMAPAARVLPFVAGLFLGGLYLRGVGRAVRTDREKA